MKFGRLLACIQVCILCMSSVSAWCSQDLPLTPGNERTIVYISLSLYDIFDINENSQTYSMMMSMRLRWTDPRLSHEGQADIKRPLEEIWYPNILLPTGQKNWTPIPKYVSISPSGEVMYQLNIRGVFSQTLNLSEYPFDQHIFNLPIYYEYSQDEFGLLPDPQKPFFFTKKITAADWTVNNYQIKSEEEAIAGNDIYSRFSLSFEATRRPGYIVIKFIIPLIFIVAMSWIVFWIDPREIRSQFSIAVTSVLTLIAYHIALANKLPEIPYLTNMDIFIFGATVIVFTSLLEVLKTSHYVSLGKVDQVLKMDKVCRWLFPTVFAIVTAYSFFIR